MRSFLTLEFVSKLREDPVMALASLFREFAQCLAIDDAAELFPLTPRERPFQFTDGKHEGEQAPLCEAISRFFSDPAADIRELVFRDVLNVAMGNTDNHGRNSAVLKTPDGAVRLSPLYDFAPMFLDDQGIPRICRWTGAQSGGMPDWGALRNA